jgi:hypothetical protein
MAMLVGCSEARTENGVPDEQELEVRSDALATPALPSGGKYEAYQNFLVRQRSSSGAVTQRAAVAGIGDSLETYAGKCDIAAGIHVPAFSCQNGTEVPGQGNGVVCDKPNVLNNECDPGSKFQVLARTPDAVVVAHCRKDGQPVSGTLYNDIAVIQYNKRNGAQCFYQALISKQGAAVPAPASDAGSFWLTPAATESIRCTGCHDNGGLIRSPYLAQLTTGPNAFPNTAEGFDNNTTPLKYVGLDFALNRSWSITGPSVVGAGLPCVTCHRLAVSNYFAFSQINGTAAHFAVQATAAVQSPAKNPHSISSPIWMRPGQILFDANASASAKKFQDCANGYWAGQSDGFQSGTPTAGCTFTPLATSWNGFDPAQAVLAVTRL